MGSLPSGDRVVPVLRDVLVGLLGGLRSGGVEALLDVVGGLLRGVHFDCSFGVGLMCIECCLLYLVVSAVSSVLICVDGSKKCVKFVRAARVYIHELSPYDAPCFLPETHHRRHHVRMATAYSLDLSERPLPRASLPEGRLLSSYGV